jgi:N-acetylmuramoyl-L-alanine amidase
VSGRDKAGVRIFLARATIVLIVVGVVLMDAGTTQAMLLDGHGAARHVTSRATSTSLRPPISRDLIPFGHRRKRETALYSRRHYGVAHWRLLHRRVIVLHFTGGNSYSSAWNTFAANTPDLGELPGVCAHFIVGRRGTIHKLVPLSIRCRHTIGLNYISIGVEMVQPTGAGAHWADQQILHRRPQIRSALRLVKWLKARFHIRRYNVIGHAMANGSPFFKDLEGWRNTHTDWLRRDVKIFRRRLARMS